MRLDKPLAELVYNELREIRSELDELEIDFDDSHGSERCGQIRERLGRLLLASDEAAMRKKG